MAELTLAHVDQVIAANGFVTIAEPACGAGGMVIAAADVIASKGIDIGRHLYVEATDLSPMAWRMAYLQLSLRGILAGE
jgi:type I restriction-modification system DNA methylase subunit